MAKKQKKNPWVSAILNLILPGFGYIYAGKRLVFGIGLTLFMLVNYAIGLFAFHLVYGNAEPSVQIFILAIVMQVWFSIIFAYDGYKEAKEINKR